MSTTILGAKPRREARKPKMIREAPIEPVLGIEIRPSWENNVLVLIHNDISFSRRICMPCRFAGREIGGYDDLKVSLEQVFADFQELQMYLSPRKDEFGHDVVWNFGKNENIPAEDELGFRLFVGKSHYVFETSEIAAQFPASDPDFLVLKDVPVEIKVPVHFKANGARDLPLGNFDVKIGIDDGSLEIAHFDFASV